MRLTREIKRKAHAKGLRDSFAKTFRTSGFYAVVPDIDLIGMITLTEQKFFFNSLAIVSRQLEYG